MQYEHVPSFPMRINVLDAPKLGSVLNDAPVGWSERPFPWMADLRYVWVHPIPYTYPSIQKSVMQSSRIRGLVDVIAAETNVSHRQVMSRAVGFLNGIRASLSRVWCRFLGYLMFKVFRRLMKSLMVAPRQMQVLRKADQSGIPIVYLPLHRSHLDYQIITWVVWHWGIRLPLVAAGDNLNLGGFGWLLRATGAFFIRRKLDPTDESTRDVLYRAVLKEYLIGLLKAGLSVEFFLEGTRSRMGKSLLPKNGLISNVLEAVEHGDLADVYLVPTSVTYTNVVEGIFYNELMGLPKLRESFMGVIKGVIQSFKRDRPCGIVSVDFGEPVLLSEELRKIVKWMSSVEMPQLDYAKNSRSYRELLPWQDHSVTHRNRVRAIGYDLVYSAQRQQPVMISALLATLFLCKYRRSSVRLSQVCQDLDAFAREVNSLGFEVLGWSEPSEKSSEAVLAAFDYFEGAVQLVEGSKPTLQLVHTHKSYITLAYHKNALLPIYTIISAAALVRSHSGINGDRMAFVKQVGILCSTLRYEMLLCNPCSDIQHTINTAIDFVDNCPAFPLQFYGRIIKPILITMHEVTICLIENKVKFEGTPDNEFIKQFVREMANNPDLSYMEAANSESIYNALKALRAWGAVNEQSVKVVSNYLITQVMNKVRGFVQDLA